VLVLEGLVNVGYCPFVGIAYLHYVFATKSHVHVYVPEPAATHEFDGMVRGVPYTFDNVVVNTFWVQDFVY